MDKSEFKIISATLKAAYPDPKFLPDKIAMNVWYTMLSDIDFKLAQEAVSSYIQTEHFPPSISDIRKKASVLTQKVELSPEVAWGMVRQALSNSIYNSINEFEKLPITVQKTLGSADQLRAWAMLDLNTVDGVIHSNFLRSYVIESDRMETIKTSPERYAALNTTKHIEQIEVKEDHTIHADVVVDDILQDVINRLKGENE